MMRSTLLRRTTLWNTTITRHDYSLTTRVEPLVHRHATITLRYSSTTTSSDVEERKQRRRIVPPPVAVSERPHVLYHNPRRVQSVALSALASGQVTFWTYSLALTTSTSASTTEVLLSPALTAGGFGLSLFFAWMVHSYLKRLVAHVDLMVNKTGPQINVVAHTPIGRLTQPVAICARHIVPGTVKDVDANRHWTFGVVSDGDSESSAKKDKEKIRRKNRPFYYILDMKKWRRVHDSDTDGLRAIVKGGDAFMAWNQKRDALIMKQRWREWKDVGQK